MKKFTMFFAVMLTILLISAPAFAGSNVHANGPGDDIAVGGNIQANGAGDDTIVGGDFTDNTKSLSDNQLGIQSGNRNTAINGDVTGGEIDNSSGDYRDNTIGGDANVAGGSINTGDQSTGNNRDNTYTGNRSGINSGNTDDHSILKDADLSDSQNGLANQKGHDNQQGLLNQKGSGVNQAGLLNQNGAGNQMGLINLKGGSQMGLVNVKGSGNQAGIQLGVNNSAVNGDNTGIIIQQANSGGGNNFPNGDYATGDNCEPGTGGGGNNNVNAFVDNSSTYVEDKREFAPGPTPVIAGFADYVGSETPGHTYSTIDEMLTFGRVFTESQLESMASKRGIRGAIVAITMMDSNMARQKPTIHPTAKERTVTVYYKAAVPSPIRRGAFITVAMKSVKGFSVETLGKAGMAVLEVGGNSLFLTAEGFDITQSQHSVAVGPGVSFSSIGGSDQSKGVTGGGGLTYSYGVFGKNYKPFLRGMALYVEDVDHKYALKGEKIQK